MYVRQQQKVNLMNTFNNKISKLILEACEELLPKTTEANNAKIKKSTSACSQTKLKVVRCDECQCIRHRSMHRRQCVHMEWQGQFLYFQEFR